MNKSQSIAASALTAGIVAGTGVMAGLTGATPAGAATSTACVTTRTHTHTSSPTGAWSDTRAHEIKCGKDYEKWTVRFARTAKGATTYAVTFRNEAPYPHYVQTERETLTSTKGVVTHKYIVTRG